MQHSSFVSTYARIRAIKPLGDYIVYFIREMNADVMEAKIRSKWSLVDTVKSTGKENMLAVLDNVILKYPDVAAVVKKSRDRGNSSMKTDSLDLLRDIDRVRLVQHIRRQLPAHGLVLERHMDWVDEEVNKIATLLS